MGNQYEDKNDLVYAESLIEPGRLFFTTDSQENLYMVREIINDANKDVIVIYDEVTAVKFPKQLAMYKDQMTEHIYCGRIKIFDMYHNNRLSEHLEEVKKKRMEVDKLYKEAREKMKDDLGRVRKYGTKIVEKEHEQIELEINTFLGKCYVNYDGFKVESLNIHEYPRDGKHDPIYDPKVYYDRAVILYSYLADPTKD